VTGDPDYTQCSLEELIEIQERIDRAAWPDRAAALDREIARRMAARPVDAGVSRRQPTTPGAPLGTTGIRLDEPIAFKPGRAMSAKRAVGAAAGLIFGLAFVVHGVATWDVNGWLVAVFGAVVALTSATDVAYHLFNAFHRQRFSDQDMLTRSQEPDPFARSIGLEAGVTAGQGGSERRFPGEFCPFCGARTPADADCCPACGKDV
jgi:hypothetical protein